MRLAKNPLARAALPELTPGEYTHCALGPYDKRGIAQSARAFG